MIVSQAIGLSIAEPASTSASAGAAGVDDGVFALAVKDAGREKTPSGAKDGEKAAASKDEKGAVSKTERKTTGKGEAAADKDAADDEGGDASLTGDVLGRLLAASLAGTQAAMPAPQSAPSAEEAPAEEGEMQERLVISTVVDLAGAVEDGQAAPGRVALEVLKMETHFEPGAGTAEIVQGRAEDAAPEGMLDLAALAADAPAPLPVKAGETAAPAPRMSFDEALQKLGGQWTGSGGSDTSGSGAGGQPGQDGGGAAAKQGGKGARGTEDGLSLRPAAPIADKAPAAVAYPSMTDQVASRIIDALAPGSAGTSEAANRPSASGEAYLRLTAGGAALKTLTIQLQPENLGQLDVSMRLVDGRLTLELAATQRETAQMLAADKHGLKKLLEHAGFAVDDAAITIVARERTNVTASASADGAGSGTASGGEGNGRSAPQQGDAGGGRNPQRQPAEQRPALAERAPAAAAASARGVFL